MFLNKIDFHRLFDGMMRVVFSSFGKSEDFLANNVRLTLSQMTKFRLFHIERVCRLQF